MHTYMHYLVCKSRNAVDTKENSDTFELVNLFTHHFFPCWGIINVFTPGIHNMGEGSEMAVGGPRQVIP